MSTDEQILRMVGKLAPVSVEDVAKALRDDQGSVRQKMQRMRRSGLLQVAQRKQVATRVKCWYELAPEPEKPKLFDGHLSKTEVEKFKQSIRGTPWEQLGVLV